MIEQLKAVLGLPETSQEAEVLALVTGWRTAWRGLAEELELNEEATEAQIRGAIVALRSGRDSLAQVQAELAELQGKLARREAEQVVEEALRAGKITPAQREWAMRYAREDAEGFATFVEKAPQVVPLGEMQREREKIEPGGSLADDELAMCKALGVSPEAFVAEKQRRAGGEG